MKAQLLFLVLAALALPLRAGEVATVDPLPPAKFTSIFIEQDEGKTSIVIETSGDTVIYTKKVDDKVVEVSKVQPASDDWLKFIKALNDAKIYKWAQKYEYPGDGINWAFELVMQDRRLVGAGMNEYPKQGNEAQPQADPKVGPSISYQRFWQAALELVGKGAPPTASK